VIESDTADEGIKDMATTALITVTAGQANSVHAVGLAAVCWAIWRTRNAVCFDNKKIKSPTEIVCMICSFLTYWAGLLKEDLKNQVSLGAEAIKTAALFFHKLDLKSQPQEENQLVPFAA